METEQTPVRQLRLVVEAEEYDEALAFFRDVLGMPEQEAYVGAGDARVAILDAGRATLELANPAQRRMIDDVEVGRQTGVRLRVAFEVDDAVARTDRWWRPGRSSSRRPSRRRGARSTPGWRRPPG
jgi:catechol 2,3-dioxygenase-like lactoylglutathione lyase family enzyme